MGSVENGMSSFAIGNFAMVLYAGHNFALPVYPIDVKLVAPKPKPLPPFSNAVKPFAGTVWISIVACFAGVSVGLSLLQAKGYSLGMVSTALGTFGALCSQSKYVSDYQNWLFMVFFWYKVLYHW